MPLNRIQRPLIVFVAACLGGVVLGVAIRPVIPVLSGNSAEDPSGTSLSTPQSPATILTKRSTKLSGVTEELVKLPASQRTLWLATQAESATPDQLARLVALAKKENDMDIELALALAGRWADLDPTHMMKTLVANEEDDYRIWKVLCTQWAKSDPEEAVAQFASANDSEDRDRWNGLMWTYLMRYAPEVGFKTSSQLGQSRRVPDLRYLGKWALRNPKEAADTVLKHLDSRNGQSQAMGEIGKAWGSTDPKAALEYAQSIPSTMARLELAENVLQSWTMSDPEAAAEYAASAENPMERAMLGKGIAAGLAKTDPRAALAWAQDNLRSSTRARAIGEIVSSVAEHNAPAAAGLVATMEPGGAMNRAVSELVGKWVNSDPTKNDAMFTWIENLTDSEARERAVEGLEWQLSMHGPGGLINFVAGDHGHLATERMLRRAAVQRAHQDPESAVAWAEALPKDRATDARNAVIEAWGNIDSQAVARWEANGAK